MRSYYLFSAILLTASVAKADLLGMAVDPLHPPDVSGTWTGLPYLINSVTGTVTPITQSLTFHDGAFVYPSDNHFILTIGDSPFPGTIFGSSPVNLYTANYDTGTSVFYYSGGSALDLAFDSANNVLYGTFGDTLSTISLTPCSGPCPPQPIIGSFGGPQILAMGYVPGAGLYGVDEMTGVLWRINPQTAALTFVGPTGVGLAVNGLSITDIEFDTSTGRLIASAGGVKQFGSGPIFPTGKIYLLDRFTGSMTLLNDNAPNFFGLAEPSPEPSTLVLVTVSSLLFGAMVGIRRKRIESRN